MGFFLTVIFFYANSPAERIYIDYDSLAECEMARQARLAVPIADQRPPKPVTSVNAVCTRGRAPPDKGKKK